MPDRALKLNRRDFLQATATGVAAAAFGCQSGEGGAGTLDIVDCHTHFFDPTRPQGIPWPGEMFVSTVRANKLSSTSIEIYTV